MHRSQERVVALLAAFFVALTLLLAAPVGVLRPMLGEPPLAEHTTH
jgi:hypothetical protein